jgi:uncharacterized protein YbaR (Trm112 family)
MTQNNDQSESPGGDDAGVQETPAAARVEVDPRLLDVLVCPLTKGPLVYDRVAGELVSRSARLAYPIRDGIPIMLPEDARPLDDA